MPTVLLLNSLSALPCFKSVTNSSAIKGGLSNPCFKVAADNHFYFAKSTSEQRLDNEIKLAKITELEGLSPTIFYYDKQWFISAYIDGDNLAIAKIPLKDKIEISITLMNQFHLLTTSNPEKINTKTIKILNTIENLNGLFCHDYQAKLISQLNKLGDEIEALLASEINNNTNKLVCCHSDINFSNVLRDKKQRAWLIDFEYACFAPAEFDVAMFIAVNNIPNSKVNLVIELYEQQAMLCINPMLLKLYLLYCYLINGLWYHNRSLDKVATLKHKTKESMTKLAAEQWHAFDCLNQQLALSIDATPLLQFI